MRRVLAFAVAVLGSAMVLGADSITTWAVQPFLPRKALPPGEKPPPRWYVSVKEVPAGAEVQIKVVQCPKGARLFLHNWRGGPVPIASSNEFTDLTPGKTVTHKADKMTRLMLEARMGGEGLGLCKDLKRKDGGDLITWSIDEKDEVTVEVLVVAP